MIYQTLATLYRAVDDKIIAHLPLWAQRRLRSFILFWARRAYPRRLAFVTTDHLMARRSIVTQTSLAGTGSADSLRVNVWPPALPDWVKEDMAEITQTIDPTFDPYGDRARRTEYNSVAHDYDHPGQVYAQLRSEVRQPIDFVLLVPWLKQGGADLGVRHFARALSGDFNQNVLVIATEPTDSPWARHLPPQVQFLDAGKRLNTLSDNNARIVLVRLLLQLAPKTIHVMNSQLGWHVIQYHSKALRTQSRLYAALYCDDFTAEGIRVGYAQKHLGDCYALLDGITTDNTQNLRTWAEGIGVPPSIFNVVFFPAPEPVVSVPTRSVCPDTILWAGRLDRQKRLDVLLGVAQRMPDVAFDVYGRPLLESMSAITDQLSALPNVSMRGPYDNFYSIAQPHYAALLYTTAWDGLPNVLLEAARAGLPIVAPKVGGITDFIADERLVENPDDIEGYVKQLRALLDDRDAREVRVQAQVEILRAQHQWSCFVESLRSIPGYIRDNSATSQRPSRQTAGSAA